MHHDDNKPPQPISGAADWMALAAAPTFAIMALQSGCFGEAPANVLCTAAHGLSPLRGMTPMYLLMSAFHVVPWMKLISARRGAACATNARGRAPAVSTATRAPCKSRATVAY